ncbi:MAG: FAD synthetase family protein [Alistipes sp.]|nr:FAD synthetase family protein [Alistipes sp.]
MRVFRGVENLPKFRRAVATMGSFDGVHGGHLVLIRQVIERAKELGGESVVLTFDPHPRFVLGTGEGLQLLSTLEEKIELLDRAGIDNLIIIPFTREFSHQTPEEFIRSSLKQIGIERLVVGYNHRFGHNKEGDYNYLEREKKSFKIEMVEQQLISDNKVSSTIIRQAIEQGDIGQAIKLLSHPYIIICHMDENGIASAIDTQKLLPQAGEYTTIINGDAFTLKITKNRELKILDWRAPKDGCNKHKVTLEITQYKQQ